MPQFVPGTSKVAANRRKMLDPTKTLDKVRDVSDDDVVAILGHRTPGAAYPSTHPPLAEMGEPEDPMRELVKPTDGAAAGDRIRYIQFTDSMYFAPMVPYVRSWMASTRFRGVDPGTLSGRQIIEARERDLDKIGKMLLESEAFDAARSSVRGCTVHGHSLRLDQNGMLFDMLARSVMNPDGSVSIVKDQVGRPLDKAVPVGKPMSDADLKSRTTIYRVDGEAARADKELVTYIQRIHTLRTMWGFKPMSVEPEPRFLNAGFFQKQGGDETPCPVDEPLALDAGPYRLGVNIGKHWGLGPPGEPVDTLLKDIWPDREILELEVSVRAHHNIEVDKPIQTLQLPRQGDSPRVYFQLDFPKNLCPWRHRLNIDLCYKGHLLQCRHLEVEVVQCIGDAPSSDKLPDGPLIFNRASRMSSETLAALDDHPRSLTIAVDYEDGHEGGHLDLCFYGRTQDRLGKAESKLTDAMLNTLLGRTRRALQHVMNSYSDQIGGSPEQLRTGLWELADAGCDFYKAVLPSFYAPQKAGPNDLTKLDLTPGQVIQVAPLSQHAGVPWELLYERHIEPFNSRNLDLVELCPDFLNHQLQSCSYKDKQKDCPYNKPKVICPYGFWGYRYVIEQLPNPLRAGKPPKAVDLPLYVRNKLPLELVALVYEYDNTEKHLTHLGEMAPAGVHLDSVRTRDECKKAFDGERDILYFFAHGGVYDKPVLELGPRINNFEFTSRDLENMQSLDLSDRNPLVVLNACESAAYRPDIIDSLLEEFVDKGASGIIGTQVQVQPGLAAGFITNFFRRFLGKQSLGNALFEARLELLHKKEGDTPRPDPRGLAYSLFATADVRLAQPVLEEPS